MKKLLLTLTVFAFFLWPAFLSCNNARQPESNFTPTSADTTAYLDSVAKAHAKDSVK